MKSKGESGYFREEYAFNSQRANCADRLGITSQNRYETLTIFVQSGLSVLNEVTPDRFTSYRGSINNCQDLRDAAKQVNVKAFRREKDISGWVSDHVVREAWMIWRLLEVKDEQTRLENLNKANIFRKTGEIA